MYTLLALAFLFTFANAQVDEAAAAFASEYAKAYADAYVAAEQAYTDAEASLATPEELEVVAALGTESDDALGTDDDDALATAATTLSTASSDLAIGAWGSDPGTGWTGARPGDATSRCMATCGCLSWWLRVNMDRDNLGLPRINVNCNRFCGDKCCGIGNWDITGNKCNQGNNIFPDDASKMSGGCTDFCKYQTDTAYIQSSCRGRGSNSEEMVQSCLDSEAKYAQTCESYTPTTSYRNLRSWCYSRTTTRQQMQAALTGNLDTSSSSSTPSTSTSINTQSPVSTNNNIRITSNNRRARTRRTSTTRSRRNRN